MKELRFSTDQNDEYAQSDKDTADVIKDNEESSNDVGYVNKGFNDSSSSKEELSNKVSPGTVSDSTIKFIVISIIMFKRYVNTAATTGVTVN